MAELQLPSTGLYIYTFTSTARQTLFIQDLPLILTSLLSLLEKVCFCFMIIYHHKMYEVLDLFDICKNNEYLNENIQRKSNQFSVFEK